MPPESPRGDVKLMSRGVVSGSARDTGQRTPMLHVGLAASNDNDVGPWIVDGQEQRLFLPGYRELAPAPTAATTRLAIAPGQSGMLDLYFRLPPGAQDADDIDGFEVLWRVQAPARTVAERTPFRRETLDRGGYRYRTVEPSIAIGLGVGFGSPWWYDPFGPHYYPYGWFPPAIYYRVPRYRYYGPPRHRFEHHRRFGRPAPPLSATPNRTAPAPAVPSQPNRSAPASP